MATFVTCTVGTGFMYGLTEKTWSDFILILFGLGLALPTGFNPKSITLRMFIAITACLGIVFATNLSATIIGIFTIPILRSQAQSIEQITNGDYYLAGDRFAFLKMAQLTQVNDFLLNLLNFFPTNLAIFKCRFIRRIFYIHLKYSRVHMNTWNSYIGMIILLLLYH